MPISTSTVNSPTSASTSAASTSTCNSSTILPLPSIPLSLSRTRFSSWYPNFKRVSQKATILNLIQLTTQTSSTLVNQDPDGDSLFQNLSAKGKEKEREIGFLQWYESDGIVLPHGSDENTAAAASEEEEEEEDHEEEEERWKFDELDAKIRNTINKYDGAVFPKLDWSAPRDAAFLLPGNNLRCVLPSDIYLLLKGSDFVSKDIEQIKELESYYSKSCASSNPPSRSNSTSDLTSSTSSSTLSLHLILKPHLPIPTSQEFRCFVRSNQLIGFCQRDSAYFSHLNEGKEARSLRTKIRRMIGRFWWDEMGGREGEERNRKRREESKLTQTEYKETREELRDAREEEKQNEVEDEDSSKIGLSSYVFDVYLTRDFGKTFLMDINPWLQRTDSLLWDWEELEEKAERGWRRSWREFQNLNSFDGSLDLEEDESEDEDEDQEDWNLPLPTLRLVPNPNVSASSNGTREDESQENGNGNENSNQTVFPTQSTMTYSNNMVPSDFLEATEGMGLAEAARKWERRLKDGTTGEEESEDEE